MKKFIYACVLILTSGVVFAADQGGFHTFMDTKGRTIRARIVDYDPSTKKLQIERDDQKRVWVGTGIFDDDDRKYILAWFESNTVMSKDALDVSIETKKGLPYSSNTVEGKKTMKAKLFHIVTINKLSDAPVEGLKIDYRYFVKEVDGYGHTSKTRQLGGEITLGSVTNSQTLTFKTDPVDLITEYDIYTKTDMFGTSTEEDMVRDDQLIGIWLKVQGSCVDGVPIVRDICYPPDLNENVQWEYARLL